MGIVNQPIPPLDHEPHAAGAPPGVITDFDAFKRWDGGPGGWHLSRPGIVPRIIIVHTNAARGEGSSQSQKNWGNASENNTKPHYCINNPTPFKGVPTDRRAIANSTGGNLEAATGERDCSFWTIAIETADPGSDHSPQAPDGSGVALDFVSDEHAELCARIIAYEAIAWDIPLQVPLAWNGTGLVTHTEPFPFPHYTTKKGKSCPTHPKKERVLRGDVWARTRELYDAWTGAEPAPADDGSTTTSRAGATGPTTEWSAIPLSDRRIAAMQILTTQYGFPVNGAAGIVGNLEAESGIIPNRVQGSKGGSPMTAADSKGVQTKWTAQEVMDRQEGKTGPKTGGAGLAQWTFPSRREGLFTYSFNGKVLGADILFDMEAQLDYLVHELENVSQFRTKVTPVLRSADVTVDVASDIFLFEFENPAVQDEAHRDKRRGFCREALANFSGSPGHVIPGVIKPESISSTFAIGEAEQIVIAYIATPPADAPPNSPWMVCINGMVRYATNYDAEQAKKQGLDFVQLNSQQYAWLLRDAGLD